MTVIGVAPPTATAAISPFDFFAKELQLVGCWANETTFARGISMLAMVGAEQIITHELDIEDGPAAVELAKQGTSGKVLLRPNRTP